MTAVYMPQAWFWVVAGSTTQVYSSAAAAYVPVTDAGYVTWLGTDETGHNHPTRIPSEAELFDVLAVQHPAALGTLGTNQQRAARMLQVGTTVTVTSTGTPALSGTYGISQLANANIVALQVGLSAGIVPGGGGASFPYKDAAGVDHTFTADQFKNFATAMFGYVFTLTRIAFGSADALPSPVLTIP